MALGEGRLARLPPIELYLHGHIRLVQLSHVKTAAFKQPPGRRISAVYEWPRDERPHPAPTSVPLASREERRGMAPPSMRGRRRDELNLRHLVAAGLPRPRRGDDSPLLHQDERAFRGQRAALLLRGQASLRERGVVRPLHPDRPQRPEVRIGVVEERDQSTAERGVVGDDAGGCH
jgi:hypothetical protein